MIQKSANFEKRELVDVEEQELFEERELIYNKDIVKSVKHLVTLIVVCLTIIVVSSTFVYYAASTVRDQTYVDAQCHISSVLSSRNNIYLLNVIENETGILHQVYYAYNIPSSLKDKTIECFINKDESIEFQMPITLEHPELAGSFTTFAILAAIISGCLLFAWGSKFAENDFSVYAKKHAKKHTNCSCCGVELNRKNVDSVSNNAMEESNV